MVSFDNVKKVLLATNGAVLIQQHADGEDGDGEVVVYWKDDAIAKYENWDWAISGYRYALKDYLRL